MKHHYYNRHRHPQGITLIEVMFASGIALFGLLVVIALIPLAGNEVRVGLQTDRMASLGRNAVKEFDIRGMRDPNQWSLQDGSPVFLNTTPGNVRWFAGMNNGKAQYLPQPQAYAIDPRFVTRHGNVLFPYSSNATWKMPRISLRTRHPRPAANGTPVFIPLTPLTADQLFMARDDLVLNFPDDRSLMSKPNWGLPSRKRQSRGELSWMATVVPLNVYSARPGNDEYLLSIVVFSARNLATQDQALQTPDEVANVPERTTSVKLLGGGFSGGEVLLSHRFPSTVINKQLYAENVLKVQTNSWIMLSGQEESDNGNIKHYFRWYRVLNAAPVVSNGAATRQVTLQGADWELPAAKTQATIMEGVIGVFEKRIRLETSSLW
ncbi:MAG: hypothetical protein ABGX05_00480 [Pirellulaceae bacterium]